MKILNLQNYNTYNKVYNSIKDAHKYPNINLVRLEKWFLKKRGKILDHGFGYCENSIHLAKEGYKVYGTEISKKLVNFALRKIKIHNVKNRVFIKYINPKMKKIPYKNKFFDNIISLGVIQYLGEKENVKYTLQELSRCLKKDGKIIISIFAPQNTFIKKSKKIGNNLYFYKGFEKFHKKTKLFYKFYVPKNKVEFKKIFPKEIKIFEVGSWGNDYCGMNGMHYVALGKKVK